jgi:hypothetical protein
MKEFEVKGGEDVLCSGSVLRAFLDAFGAYRSRGQKVLARHAGVEELDVDPAAFYPIQALLNGMRELQEQFGQTFMTRIGRSIYERAIFPEGLDSFEAVLTATDVAYYMNHVNAEGKIGHYEWIKKGPRVAHMVCDNPYPCAFDLGIFSGVAAKFGVEATITHLDEHICRHKGGEVCTYRIEW